MNILVAEDEKDLRELLKLNLENEGYNVILACNGSEALELFSSNNIDLGLFDIMMPFLDGFNLLRKIRETSNIPVIMLTARGEEMDKVLGFGLGADDYIVKPFFMSELIARVAARLRRNTGKIKSTPTITIGKITLDTDACSVIKNGKDLELNAKEYLILKLLMENPDRIFTKKQLYTAVWEEDYYYDDNTIMVYISHIRNKIEDDPKNSSLIKTIKGIGYKLIVEKTIV